MMTQCMVPPIDARKDGSDDFSEEASRHSLHVVIKALVGRLSQIVAFQFAKRSQSFASVRECRVPAVAAAATL